MKIVFKNILILSLIILAASCENKLETTAPELLNEFRTNEAKAIATYLDKQVEIAVPIQIMMQDMNGGIFIIFNDNKSEYGIQFNIPKAEMASAKKIKANTVAYIVGTCADAGKGKDIVFKNCKVVE